MPASIPAAAHVQINGVAPTADSLHDALVASIGRAATAPTDSHSLADLLLLDLGLHASPARDLRTLPASQADLDPLQQVIVLVEGLLPVTRHATSTVKRHARPMSSPDDCNDPA